MISPDPIIRSPGQPTAGVMFCIRARLYRLRNALYEGHGFSRALKSDSNVGFSP
jgi:hypothetical protein